MDITTMDTTTIDTTTIDLNQIISVLSDKTTMIVMIVSCAVLALLLLALNWKKKRFLIYWAIVFLPVGAILFDMNNIADTGLKQLPSSYSGLVGTISDGLVTSMHNIGIGLMAAGIVCIILFIVNGVIEGKKQK